MEKKFTTANKQNSKIMKHSIENKYIGELRTSSTHIKSGKNIITDAPVDNN